MKNYAICSKCEVNLTCYLFTQFSVLVLLYCKYTLLFRVKTLYILFSFFRLLQKALGWLQMLISCDMMRYSSKQIKMLMDLFQVHDPVTFINKLWAAMTNTHLDFVDQSGQQPEMFISSTNNPQFTWLWWWLLLRLLKCQSMSPQTVLRTTLTWMIKILICTYSVLNTRITVLGAFGLFTSCLIGFPWNIHCISNIPQIILISVKCFFLICMAKTWQNYFSKLCRDVLKISRRFLCVCLQGKRWRVPSWHLDCHNKSLLTSGTR